MRPRHPRSRLALVLATAAGLFALGGCYQSSAGDVRLRAASMTAPNDDQRLPAESPSSLKWSPP
jgi:hypothetical protein